VAEQLLAFFFDTHIPKAVAEQLRRPDRGVDVVRCEEVGMAEASDEELLAYAIENGRAMVSVDRDFLRLNATKMAHAGIFSVLPRNQDNIGRIVTDLFEYHELIKGGAGTLEDDIHNQVRYI
jgi:predicted nuclease of predicted toxin-antitoxin system